MKLSDIKHKALSVLIYGPPGTGKTMFAGTFPKSYYLDFDLGVNTLADTPYEKNVMEVEQFNPSEPKEIARLENIITGLYKSNPYETIVLDSLTKLSASVLLKIYKQNGYTPGMDLKGTGINPMTFYGQLAFELERFFNLLCGLKCNIVLTAHDELVQEENTGVMKYLPYVDGKKFAPKLPSLFSEYYHSEVIETDGKRDFKVRTRSQGNKIYCRSRFNKSVDGKSVPVLKELEVPDYGVIMSKVLAQ